MLHPVAWAGWAGLLITALNLVPAGMFDGGHTIYVLVGRKAARLLPALVVVLLLLGFAWSGWWLWAGLVLLLGRTYAEPLNDITPLDPKRRAIAVLGLVLFLLLFMPVPLRAFGI
jgi:membrane-associated protease RseP (regulator of RpoE activity)